LPYFTGNFSNWPQQTKLGGVAPYISSFILNLRPSDVSVISAGRDMFFANVTVAGPGTLEIGAGRNFYQGDHGLLESLGQIFDVDVSNRSSGAGIFVYAGVGPHGPDYSDFAKLYFDPANRGDGVHPLAEQPGKVIKTYDEELIEWLHTRFG